MKKIISLLLLSLSIVFVSCEKNGGEEIPPQVVTEGIFILNNGNYASNDATLSLYDPESMAISKDIFQSVNGKKLGDLAQDMLVYGSKMYIAMYGSKVLFVTDKSGKIIQMVEIKKDEAVLSPRAIIGHKGKVYITLYEGYVAQMDTVKYESTLAKVGDNPEGLVAVENRLYVANSGGMNFTQGKDYGNTVSVVSLDGTIREIETIEVVKNPTKLLVNIRGEIYLISMGDYESVPNTLQRIDSKSHDVQILTDRPVTYMSMSSDSKLYFISAQYDENWNAITSVGVYNTISSTMEADFIADGSIIKNTPTSISVDPVTNDVYIGTSDYVSEGDMYVFTKEAKLKHTFGTGGLNPVGAFFVMGLK